jgi:hypothetical protein
MMTDSEIKKQIAKEYGKAFWYLSYEEQQDLINLEKEKL